MTMQIPDNLILQNTLYNLSGGSLSPFDGLANGQVIRETFAGIRKCSALWRGYLATWVIDEHGWLKLSEITKDIFLDDENAKPVNLIYDIYKDCDEPITASWITGEYEVFSGDVIGRCGSYVNVYEKYLTLQIKNGKVIGIEEHDGEWWKVKNNCKNRTVTFY